MYDYILAGAGCAGLSLAYALQQSSLRDKKILLIDKEIKNKNDRTWSFWTKEDTLFDDIVYKAWDKVWFQSPGFSKLIPLNSYRYKMIRGIDFYDFCQKRLQQNPNVRFLQGDIQEMCDSGKGAKIIVDDKVYQGNWIFNSIPPKFSNDMVGYHYLKQHFKGWIIETTHEVFDPEAATFMDFRIDQAEESRFFYILPFSKTKALVEFTIFSEDFLDLDEYDQQIKKYIRDYLNGTTYQIIEEEFGMIPMADIPLKKQKNKHIINIGMSGGMTKASSGYTFINIQKQVAEIVRLLQQSKSPYPKNIAKKRFRLYDSMLLNIMAYHRYEARDIFAILFKKHPIERVFKFLDEQSTFSEELLIMAKMPPTPFLTALGDIIWQRRTLL